MPAISGFVIVKRSFWKRDKIEMYRNTVNILCNIIEIRLK